MTTHPHKPNAIPARIQTSVPGDCGIAVFSKAVLVAAMVITAAAGGCAISYGGNYVRHGSCPYYVATIESECLVITAHARGSRTVTAWSDRPYSLDLEIEAGDCDFLDTARQLAAMNLYDLELFLVGKDTVSVVSAVLYDSTDSWFGSPRRIVQFDEQIVPDTVSNFAVRIRADLELTSQVIHIDTTVVMVPAERQHHYPWISWLSPPPSKIVGKPPVRFLLHGKLG
jgi:hypothetical protein